MEESCGVEGKEQVYKALNGQLFNMDLDLQREAKRLITLLTDKVRYGVQRTNGGMFCMVQKYTAPFHIYINLLQNCDTFCICIYIMHMCIYLHAHV